MKKILLIAGAMLLIASPALADNLTPNPSEDYYYLFSLHYAAGTLTANTPAYEIMTGTRPTVASGPYTLTIIDHLGKAAIMVSFATGTIKVPVPYQPTGVRAVITKNGTTVLTVDLFSSTCNQDGVCNAAVGEDQYNCPSDCFTQTIATPPPLSETPAPYSSAVSQAPKAYDSAVSPSGIRLAVLGFAGLITVIVLVVWTVLRKKL